MYDRYPGPESEVHVRVNTEDNLNSLVLPRGGYRISDKGGLLINNKTSGGGGGGGGGGGAVSFRPILRAGVLGRFYERGGGGGGCCLLSAD